uniref:Enhancer of polycomb homolog 1 n=1 Tax=Ovis aries TaxID=9940 RepID=A0AC11DW21_SHEEP
MSKLSFRARALDASKPLPVFRCEDLPDLHEYASINRAVPQMPTGMEKEEESDPDDKTASILNIAGHHAGGKSSGRSRILYQLFTCSGQKPDMRFCVTSTHNSLARTSYMAPSNRMVGQEMQSYHMTRWQRTERLGEQQSWQICPSGQPEMWITLLPTGKIHSSLPP